MKTLLTLLLATLCAATSYGQTIKSLGFNSTNGQVIANTGTNALTFTNGTVFFENISAGALFSGTNEVYEFDSGQFAKPIRVLETYIAETRTNLGLPLAALTNASNVTAMRALSGSTNTNHPFSGSISVTGTNNTNTLVFSNGILQEAQ
jgi:hypothetical protein